MHESSLQPALTLGKLLSDATLASAVDEGLLSEVILYHPHLNVMNLRSELVLLTEHKITSTLAIINWFNEVDLRRDALTSVYTAVATLLVLPLTTAACERSFSSAQNLLMRSTI